MLIEWSYVYLNGLIFNWVYGGKVEGIKIGGYGEENIKFNNFFFERSKYLRVIIY